MSGDLVKYRGIIMMNISIMSGAVREADASTVQVIW